MTITINGTTGIAGVDGSAGTPAVQGADTNTGIYFGADTISFAEGGAEAVQIDSSANLKFNSGYGSVATAYGCRAWVNFNGTGTVAIRASGNVTSITDHGTGEYTVNFTTALSDANYTTVITCGDASGTAKLATGWSAAPTSTAYRILTYNWSGGAAADPAYVNVAIFR